MSAAVCPRFLAALLACSAAAFIFDSPWWTGLIVALTAEAAVFAAANFDRRRLRKWSGWGFGAALVIPVVIFVGSAVLGSARFQFVFWHRPRELRAVWNLAKHA